jgi:DNA-binding winged helix-turn-helix (wHTH) protein
MLPPATAQSTFGDLRGITRDRGGQPVPGAAVTVRSLDENTDQKLTSGNDGSFRMNNLKPGHYHLTAAKTGFQSSSVTDVELSARQSLRVDIALAREGQSGVVAVNAAAERVNTENAAIGDAKGTSQIGQLPVNYRAVSTSPLAAESTSANVQQDSQGNVAVGGATPNMVGYSVGGISTVNIWTSSAGCNPYPSSEGIAEMKVTASNNNAEFAQVADVTFTTRSGTKTLHGSLFEYLQNDALDATVLNFNVKAPRRFNTFGGSLDGAVTIPKEFELLVFLMQHKDLPIANSKLLRAVWGSEYGHATDCLRTCVRSVRKKIEDDPARPEYILTEPWVGYRFHDPFDADSPGAEVALASVDDGENHDPAVRDVSAPYSDPAL